VSTDSSSFLTLTLIPVCLVNAETSAAVVSSCWAEYSVSVCLDPAEGAPAELLDDVLPHAATAKATATTVVARMETHRMVPAEGFRRSLNRLITLR
jgi:hypothetical protein